MVAALKKKVIRRGQAPVALVTIQQSENGDRLQPLALLPLNRDGIAGELLICTQNGESFKNRLCD